MAGRAASVISPFYFILPGRAASVISPSILYSLHYFCSTSLNHAELTVNNETYDSQYESRYFLLWKTRPSILVTTDPGAGAQEFSAAFENFLTMWYIYSSIDWFCSLVSPVNIWLKKNSSRYLEPTRRLL